jgi:hypothetical protein
MTDTQTDRPTDRPSDRQTRTNTHTPSLEVPTPRRENLRFSSLYANTTHADLNGQIIAGGALLHLSRRGLGHTGLQEELDTISGAAHVRLLLTSFSRRRMPVLPTMQVQTYDQVSVTSSGSPSTTTQTLHTHLDDVVIIGSQSRAFLPATRDQEDNTVPAASSGSPSSTTEIIHTHLDDVVIIGSQVRTVCDSSEQFRGLRGMIREGL